MTTKENPSITIKIQTRWQMRQLTDTTAEVIIPLGEGAPLISETAAERLLLSQAEYKAAELAALQAIVMIK